MSVQEIIERVKIAQIEGRLENVLEREKQLAALHQSIKQQFDNLVHALQKDLKTSQSLAKAEITAVLDTINCLYEQLDFHGELAKERRLKNGGRLATFSVPLGTTLIVQLSSSPTTSTICPLAATLAAGNSAIIIGSLGLFSTNELIEQILLEALDHESFHLVKCSNVQDCEAYLQEKYASVVINGLESSQIIGSAARAVNSSIHLLEPYYGVPAGIIGRSCGRHVDTIVKQIQETTLGSTNGNRLRVPRLFFVDESIVSSVKDKLQYQREKSDQDLDEWLRKHYTGLVTRYSNKQDHNETFPDVPSVETMTVLASASGSEIVLIPTRSLDHTIDMLNKINFSQGAGALYIFADGKEAFYLGNFINCSHVYINEMPHRSLGTSAKDTWVLC
ncbi:hypothetical protein HBI12_113520 [Parastagonospora nodorum]|nr:hypothetical protein HBI12_113520 [Parastagonospora nodorum]KAH5424952.1 hypothetical protein HBI47_124300 [Parastagonospora nodorum]